MISPTTYTPGEIIAKLKSREHKESVQKRCPVCRKGMYFIESGELQCENCEFREPK